MYTNTREAKVYCKNNHNNHDYGSSSMGRGVDVRALDNRRTHPRPSPTRLTNSSRMCDMAHCIARENVDMHLKFVRPLPILWQTVLPRHDCRLAAPTVSPTLLLARHLRRRRLRDNWGMCRASRATCQCTQREIGVYMWAWAPARHLPYSPPSILSIESCSACASLFELARQHSCLKKRVR